MPSNFPKLNAAVLRLALIIGVVTVLYFGKSLLLTLTLAGLLAALVNPIDNFLRKKGWPASLGITVAVLTIVLFFAGLFLAVGQQAKNFIDNWEQTKQNLARQLTSLEEKYPVAQLLPDFGLTQTAAGSGGDVGGEAAGAKEGLAPGQNANPQSSPQGDDPSLGNTDSSPGGNGGSDSSQPTSGSTFGQFSQGNSQIISYLGSTFGILGDFLLMFVYIILFLSQKDRLYEFVLRRAPAEKRSLTRQTLDESTGVVQKYLRGRLILIGILSVLYSVGFLIVGVNYAILIAILVAILSIIPYLGNIIGGVFAIALAVAGGGGSTAILGILITMSVAQTLESYVLTPLIVGDEVDINPLTTIICVIGMTILWGPVGAIIAIPVFAILRVIFSHVEGLRDWAFLMGTE